MPLVFISALIGILTYIKILPLTIKWIGWGINKITKMGDVESYVPIATTLLGSPQVFVTLRNQIPKLNKTQLFTVCMAVISSSGASMLGSYMTMIKGKYVVIAVFLNFFSGLVISAIVNPYQVKFKEDCLNIEKEEDKPTFFEMLGDYIISGFNLAIIVAAMVIRFISIISFLNNICLVLFGISFTGILGYIFSPVAFLMGVPYKDIFSVGQIMATKLLTNEVVAMGTVSKTTNQLSNKSIAMISTYLVSFANFGTLGIISGAVKSINNNKAKEIASFSIKLIIGGTLAGILTAVIIGLFY